MIATLTLEDLVGKKSIVGIFCGHPHMNLHDGTDERFRGRELPMFCVQHRPEASFGLYDSDDFFRDLILMMKAGAPAVYSEPSQSISRDVIRLSSPS
jgi:hypothetical protein